MKRLISLLAIIVLTSAISYGAQSSPDQRLFLTPAKFADSTKTAKHPEEVKRKTDDKSFKEIMRDLLMKFE